MARNLRNRILAEKPAAEPVPSHGSLPQAQGPMSQAGDSDTLEAASLQLQHPQRTSQVRDHVMFTDQTKKHQARGLTLQV